jgi:hypothetical protein
MKLRDEWIQKMFNFRCEGTHFETRSSCISCGPTMRNKENKERQNKENKQHGTRRKTKKTKNESWSLTPTKEHKQVAILKQGKYLDLKQIDLLVTGGNYIYDEELLNSMERIPFLDGDSRSAIQKMSRLLWKFMKVHYCVHKSPSPVPILTPKRR